MHTYPQQVFTSAPDSSGWAWSHWQRRTVPESFAWTSAPTVAVRSPLDSRRRERQHGRLEVEVFEVAYETTFCATHVLHDGGKPIEPQHGHDWRVEVVATGETLDRLGVVVDGYRVQAGPGPSPGVARATGVAWPARAAWRSWGLGRRGTRCGPRGW